MRNTLGKLLGKAGKERWATLAIIGSIVTMVAQAVLRLTPLFGDPIIRICILLALYLLVVVPIAVAWIKAKPRSRGFSRDERRYLARRGTAVLALLAVSGLLVWHVRDTIKQGVPFARVFAINDDLSGLSGRLTTNQIESLGYIDSSKTEQPVPAGAYAIKFSFEPTARVEWVRVDAVIVEVRSFSPLPQFELIEGKGKIEQAPAYVVEPGQKRMRYQGTAPHGYDLTSQITAKRGEAKAICVRVNPADPGLYEFDVKLKVMGSNSQLAELTIVKGRRCLFDRRRP